MSSIYHKNSKAYDSRDWNKFVSLAGYFVSQRRRNIYSGYTVAPIEEMHYSL